MTRTFLKAIDERTPLGRIGEAEDLDGAAMFLASPASNYLTDYTVAMDGGWLAW